MTAIYHRPLQFQMRNRMASHFSHHDFLVKHAATMLCERMDDWNKVFPVILHLGAHQGILTAMLKKRIGVERIIESDTSFAMLASSTTGADKIVIDEERLPFASKHFDLIISLLNLHLVNDLPGVLWQLQQVLKPGGMLLGCVLGGDTLVELRHVLLQSEIELNQGCAPRIAPNIDIKTLGQLLMRAGFQLPVTDSEKMMVSYPSLWALLQDLKGFSGGNSLMARHSYSLTRGLLNHAEKLYREQFPGEIEGDIVVTFELLYIMGMAPPNQ